MEMLISLKAVLGPILLMKEKLKCEFPHAGPVYEEFDPLLKKRTFLVTMCQALRIGQLCFPDLSLYRNVAALISYRYQDFDFEYAGNLELAKDFGAFPVYILQRKGY